MQPSVFRVDIQSPLPGDTDPFRRNDDEGKDKSLQAAFHVYTGKDAADLGQQVLIEILQHGGEEQKYRVINLWGHTFEFVPFFMNSCFYVYRTPMTGKKAKKKTKAVGEIK